MLARHPFTEERPMITAQPIFDAYIFVDWSAQFGPSSMKPKKDAIWIGHLLREGMVGNEQYCRTREEATHRVLDLLRDHVAQERRVLVGFDFPYSYPSGLAAALNMPEGRPAWQWIWHTLAEEMSDSPQNENKRFSEAERLNQRISGQQPGPFWNRPANSSTPNTMRVPDRKPKFPHQLGEGEELREFRRTEEALKARKLQLQETWKLAGVGSVGSQALLGIPRVHWLRNHPDLAAHSSVWPFETGFTASFSTKQAYDIIHVEIWPGIISRAAITEATGPGDIIDQVQVRLMCRWAAEHDIAGTLGRYFAQPPDLDPALGRVLS